MDGLDIGLLGLMTIGFLLFLIAKWLAPSRAEYEAIQQLNRFQARPSMTNLPVAPNTDASATAGSDRVGTVH